MADNRLDVNSRQEALNDPQRKLIESLQPEQRDKLKSILQQSLKQQQQPTFGNRLTAGANTAANLFLQQGGLQQPQQSKGPSDVDQLIKLATFQAQQDTAERKARLDEIKIK